MRSLGLMAIALLCSIGVAAAQQPPTQPSISPDEARDLIANSIRESGPLKEGEIRLLGGPGPQQPGQIVFHGWNCLWETVSGTDVFAVFSRPGESFPGFATVDQNIAHVAGIACVDGNALLLGTDPVTGAPLFLETFNHL
jgi:hypothetical protein